MPAENWPVMLVKGEVDPGIIEGTVRYGAWNQALYNFPIQLPGRVRAVGIADDPTRVQVQVVQLKLADTLTLQRKVIMRLKVSLQVSMTSTRVQLDIQK